MAMHVGKWGNSLGIRIPGEVAKRLDIHEGTRLAFREQDGTLVLFPILEEENVTLEGLLSQFSAGHGEEETDWGDAMGNEVW